MADAAPPEMVPESSSITPSVSDAATAYQSAMQQQSATPPSAAAASPVALPLNVTKDVEMSDRTPDRVPVCIPFNSTEIMSTNTPSVACNRSRRIE